MTLFCYVIHDIRHGEETRAAGRPEPRRPLMQRDLEAAELIDERPDEHLDAARLAPYLRAHLPATDGPL